METEPVLKLISPIPPSVNHYLGYRVVRRNGRYVAMSYKTQQAVQYRKTFADTVRQSCLTQEWSAEGLEGRHFYADAVFYFDKKSRDCNNYFKVMLDAITDTGLVWQDDNVVCERVQRIYYDAEDPRVELTIHPTEYIGIFDDVSQLEAFTSRCLDCSRYQRNCSILRDSIAGRLRSETREGQCTKYKRHKGAKNNGKEE